MTRLPGLDALRGLAALVVFALHIGAAFGMPWLFAKGYLAVDFFFMLSGYVMARTYEARLAGDLTTFQFVKARYLRLWPAMAIGGLAGLPLLLLDHSPAVALANFAFVPVLVGLNTFPLNVPVWSVFFELVANALHRSIMRVVPLVMAVSGAVYALAIWRLDDADFGPYPSTFALGLPRVLFAYCLGVMLWRRWQDAPSFAVPFPALLLVAACALPRWLPVDFLIVAGLFPLVIAGGLQMHTRLAWLGAWSFPLYAVHRPVIDAAAKFGLGLPVALVGVALLTAIAYRPANRITGPLFVRPSRARA